MADKKIVSIPLPWELRTLTGKKTCEVWVNPPAKDVEGFNRLMALTAAAVRLADDSSGQGSEQLKLQIAETTKSMANFLEMIWGQGPIETRWSSAVIHNALLSDLVRDQMAALFQQTTELINANQVKS